MSPEPFALAAPCKSHPLQWSPPASSPQDLVDVKRQKLPGFADERRRSLVFRRRERGNHFHDLVHDDRGLGRLILTERRIAGAKDRGDPSAQRIAERFPALDDARDPARKRDRRGVPV